MKKVTLIYTQSGDYTYSPYDYPVKEYNPDTDKDMLNETHYQMWSYDDFRRDSVPKYELREKELPEWLSPEVYTNTEWYLSHRWDKVLTAPDMKTARWLLTLPDAELNAVLKLLNTKKFRSEFRKSLRDQIVNWLETELSERKHKTPLSYRQWEILTRYS